MVSCAVLRLPKSISPGQRFRTSQCHELVSVGLTASVRVASSMQPPYGWHMPMARTAGQASTVVALGNQTRGSLVLPEFLMRITCRDRSEPSSASARTWYAPAWASQRKRHDRRGSRGTVGLLYHQDQPIGDRCTSS